MWASASAGYLSDWLCSPTGVFQISFPVLAFIAKTTPSFPEPMTAGAPPMVAAIGEDCVSWSMKSSDTPW